MVFKQKKNGKTLMALETPHPLNVKSCSRRRNGKKARAIVFFMISSNSVYKYCQEKFFVFWRRLQYPHIVYSNPTSE